MKNSVKTIIALFFVILIFNACDKNEVVQAYFYTNRGDVPLNLYIDDVHKGVLPFFPTIPKSLNDTIKKFALTLPVKYGKHTIQARDPNGVVKSEGKIKIKKRSASSQNSKGNLYVILNQEELCFGLGY